MIEKFDKTSKSTELHREEQVTNPRYNPDFLSDEGSYKELQHDIGYLERKKDVLYRWRKRKIKRLRDSGSLARVLTDKQLQVFDLMTEGQKTPQEISKILDIQRHAVDKQLVYIVQKLQFIFDLDGNK